MSGGADENAISLAIQTKTGPARKNFVTLQARLKTYTGWVHSTGPTPEVMAEAGFYYIGTKDHVKCFYCDGGLRNWEAGDDPWFEHARWFATCPYVLLNKGTDYIKHATQTKPPQLPAPAACSTLGHSSEGTSSSSDETSSENSSGDEECSNTSATTVIKGRASRSSSGDSDSGCCTATNEDTSSDEDVQGPSSKAASTDKCNLAIFK